MLAHLNFTDVMEDLRALALAWNGGFREAAGWGESNFNTPGLRGLCRGFYGAPGFMGFFFDLYPREDLIIEIASAGGKGISFIYCLERNLQQRFSNETKDTSIGFRQNALLKNSASKSMRLNCRHGRRYAFSLLRVMPGHHTFPERQQQFSLHDAFMAEIATLEKEIPNRYLGRISPDTAPHVSLLSTELKGKNPVTLEAAMMNIVVSQVRRYRSDATGSHQGAPLKLYDLDKVLAVSEFIKDNLAEELSVGRIQEITGLNPSKLQAGFQYLYGKSVNAFITESRLARALHLIQQSELNISEVVYSVGFNSRSYFTKIFKKRFRILPSECAGRKKDTLATS